MIQFVTSFLPQVFDNKARRLVKEIEGGILGTHVAHIGVVEFQKRGLPHLHLLVTLASEHKPIGAEQIDRIITAEIPDSSEGPQQAITHQRIHDFMLHRKCGEFNPTAPCMVAQRTSFNPVSADDDSAPNREDPEVAAQPMAEDPLLGEPGLDQVGDEDGYDSDATIIVPDYDSDATICDQPMDVDDSEDEVDVEDLLNPADLAYDINQEDFVNNQVTVCFSLCPLTVLLILVHFVFSLKFVTWKRTTSWKRD